MLLPPSAVFLGSLAINGVRAAVSREIQATGHIVPIDSQPKLWDPSELNFQYGPGSTPQFVLNPSRKVDELFDFEGYGFDDDYTSLTNSRALVIGNSVDIFTPFKVADEINDALGVKRDGYRNVVHCNATDTLPDEFYFDISRQGVSIRITLKNPDYLTRVGGTCLSPFVGVDFAWSETQFWMMGKYFVGHYGTQVQRPFSDDEEMKYIAASSKPALDAPLPELVELQAFTLGGSRVELNKTIASIDPRLVDIILPTKMANTLNTKLGATRQDLLWTFDCDTISDLPEFSLHFYKDGIEVTRTLQGPEYVLRVGGNCMSPFVGIDFGGDEPNVPTWFVGDVFLGLYNV